MIIRFFRQRRRGAIEYLTDNKLHPDVTVLRGVPGLTRKIYEALPYAQRYCAGVLAEDKLLDEGVQERVMDDFEAALGAGLNSDEYDITWIRHEDKGRTELHFVVPATILSAQRAWAPYLDRIDRPLFEALRDYCNLRYGLADPMEASRRFTTKGPDTWRKAGKGQEIIEAIDAWAANEIEDGRVGNRDDLIKALVALGFRIRAGHDHISIQGHDMERPMRLRGAWYERSFDDTASCEAAICEREASHRGPLRLRELAHELEARWWSRARRNAARARHEPVGMDHRWMLGPHAPRPAGLDRDDEPPSARRPGQNTATGSASRHPARSG